MKDFDFTDLRFIFEKDINWEKIRAARGGGEDYTPEYLMTLDNAADFSRNEVAPAAEAVDREECHLEVDEAGGSRIRLPDGMLRNINGLKELGAFCGLTLPEDVGGLDFPLSVFFGIGELFSMGDSSLGLTPMLQEGVAQVLMEFANDKIRQDYLPRLMSGERICSMGLTEAGAGSDLANMKTTARPVNGNESVSASRIRELEELGAVYLLNGSKILLILCSSLVNCVG